MTGMFGDIWNVSWHSAEPTLNFVRTSKRALYEFDGLILLVSTAVRDIIDSDHDVLLPTKWHLTREGTRSTTTLRSCGGR
jgi:hypothetical protein